MNNEISKKVAAIYGVEKLFKKTIDNILKFTQLLCRSLIRLNLPDKVFTLDEDLKLVDDTIESLSLAETSLIMCKMALNCEDEVEKYKKDIVENYQSVIEEYETKNA